MEEKNNLVIPQVPDLEPTVLSEPEISSTVEPLDPSLPTNSDNFIDLTIDDPTPPDSPNDCVAISSNFPEEKDDSMDESLSIVYENIKTPPDLNVQVDESGDIVVEVLKRNSEPYSGFLTKKVKLGPSNVNVCVSVNSKKASTNDPSKPATQMMRGKISLPTLLVNKIPSPEKEVQSTSASSSNLTVDCAICLDSYSEIVATNRNFMATSCGHVFCNVCIEKSREHYKLCPKCRKRLTKRSYHPLYLS